MKNYLFTFLLGIGPAAAMAQSAAPATGDSTNFFLHKFAQNIGKETYRLKKDATGYVYEVGFRFVDRGSPVPLKARLSVTRDFEPLSFWIKGSTSRFSTINDSVSIYNGTATIRVNDSSYTKKVESPGFTVGGYSPGTVQMVLLQYWKRHGRPARVSLLPTGSVTIRKLGNDSLSFSNHRLILERFVISGLIWGNELVWTDTRGNLVCLITNDAEGDKLEMMQEQYEGLLPELIGRAATYGMQLFMAAGNGGTGTTVADADGGVTAIVGGKLLNVKDGTTTNNSVIIIEKGKILAAGPAGTVTIPAGVRIIHAEGKTILPGLWDMHAHFEQAEWGPAYLAAGVTTVRDCGNEFNYINAVKRAIDEGQGVGPHILKAGIVDGPGPAGIGIIRASTPEEAVTVVRRYKDSGFVQIKIYSSMQPAIVKAICDEAHKQGLTVTGHIPEGMTLMQGVDSGMDMVNHIQYVYTVMKRNKDRTVDWNDPQTTAAVDFIASHHVVVDATLGVFEMIFRSVKDTITKMEPAYYTLPEPLQVLFVNMGMPPENAEKFKPMFRDMEKIVKVLHDKGVTLVAGTDMGFPGFSVDRELELYVEGGLTPLEALQTATIIPAQVMKQEAVSGSIEAGKQADLLIVDGDPLLQIRDLRKVKMVIKDGKLYEPDQLHKMASFLQ
jgi:imidazolonepropionase-like amidohydrolase